VVIGGTKIIWSLLEPVKQIIDRVLRLHQAQFPVQPGSLDHLEDKVLLVHLDLWDHKALEVPLVILGQKERLVQLDPMEV
jgi:hypothetical protein